MAVVGIDLGTTNTVVGVVRDGEARALQDTDGDSLIPSVVSFHQSGSVLVGRTAKDRRVVDAPNTVYSIKRLIGRSWSSEQVGRAKARLPFEMREGPGQAVLVVARGETFTLPEISAFVLRHAKSVAEKALGETVDRAVITVPANFNDLQRAATKVAGRVAGLEVLRILNEPTAAALAYGYGKGKGERIAIYDFGGGTFDVTILDLSNNVFEVLATAGNTFLGGDDVDLAIAEQMADFCKAEHGIDARADPQVFERLRYYAEKLKLELSQAASASIDVPDVGPGHGGKPQRLTFSMDRRHFDALALPIVRRTFDVCQEALGIARLTARDLDQVVLVGGSTRVPLVRTTVAEYFGRQPLDRIHPDEVVAMGAAIQAAALTGLDRRRSVIPKPPMPAARASEAPRGSSIPVRSSPSNAPPLPRRRSPSMKGGTLGGIGGPAPVSRFPGQTRPASEFTPAGEQDDEPTRVGPAPINERRTAPNPRGELEIDDFDDVTSPDARFAGARLPKLPPSRPSATIPITEPGSPPPTLPTWELPLELDEPALPADAFPDPPATPRVPTIIDTVPPQSSRPVLPLLVDVTPLSLCVETVSGFRDVVIARNTPVPCEQSRTFVTAQDKQETVLVRVGQGESERFDETTLLGELELLGLPPAPRGAVRVVVTFALDTNGMLDVRAADEETGRASSARLRLIGLPEPDDVRLMQERHRQHRAL
ncbi:MAG TPA: Hsp70 family protein [Polyangiaceae bacterium]|jgi:molecular chaperone DnaK|nr:Hsp70 family protein [Polyangiaceae bacterium]